MLEIAKIDIKWRECRYCESELGCFGVPRAYCLMSDCTYVGNKYKSYTFSGEVKCLKSYDLYVFHSEKLHDIMRKQPRVVSCEVLNV